MQATHHNVCKQKEKEKKIDRCIEGGAFQSKAKQKKECIVTKSYCRYTAAIMPLYCGYIATVLPLYCRYIAVILPLYCRYIIRYKCYMSIPGPSMVQPGSIPGPSRVDPRSLHGLSRVHSKSILGPYRVHPFSLSCKQHSKIHLFFLTLKPLFYPIHDNL